jgi:hypothetical protein
MTNRLSIVNRAWGGLVPSGAPKRGPGRPKRPENVGAPPTATRSTKSGQLPRRSAEDIAGALVQVVALVKKNKDGLRAEQIRSELGMEPKEMPRILKEGIATKKLKTKGQKRATTYFVG